MGTEMNVEAERAVDLVEFEKWKGYPLPALSGDGNFDKDWLHREWVAFRAGRRRAAQPADVGATLQKPELRVEDILKMVADNTPGRINLSLNDLDLYLGVVRAAIRADRRLRRPRVELDPQLKAVLDEAAKTRSTAALLPDGSAVFINYGHQPEDTAHLECTACGGSGHIDDQRATQAAQGVPVAWIRFRSDGGYEGPIMHEAIEEVRKKSGAWTPLYAAPPLSSEQQDEKGEG